MKNHKLIELLQSFGKKEWLGASKFVHSSIFNKREDVRSLFQFLKRTLGKGHKTPLSKEVLYAAICPDEDLDEQRLRYVMSFLYQDLCRYLIYTEIEEDLIEQKLLLLKALKKRNQHRLFTLEITSSNTTLDASTARNADHYHQLFRLHKLQYEDSAAQSRTNTHHFQDLVNDFDHFFVIEKLQQGCIAISHKTVLENTYRLDYLEVILDLLKQGNYEDVPAVQVYYRLYTALTNTRDVSKFQEFQQVLGEQLPIFSTSEQRSIFLLAINFCIQQFNLGNREFLRQTFELYKEGLSKHVFLDQGILDRFTYNNIALAGLGLKEFTWTGQFLETYQAYIEERYREQTFKYNLANLYYRKGDYDRAMPLLQFADFSDALHNMEARKMLAIIYYDKSELDALEALLINFKNYIRRQKEVTYHWEHYSNFIFFLSKLLRRKPGEDQSLKQLALDIRQQTKLAEKEWLLAKFPNN